MFSKQTYIQRRMELKKKFPSGILLFLGNDETGMNYADNTYHFRQDSTFLYYFGISMPGFYATIDLDSGEEIIFGDDYTIDSIIWMGDMPTVTSLAEKSGISKTETTGTLKKKLSKAENILFLPPYRAEHQIKLLNLLGIHPNEAVKKASIPFVLAVAEQRNNKTSEEITEIEKAVNTTVLMHRTAMRYAKPGMTEAHVAAKVAQIALESGGQLSFPIIATINGQTLHNHFHGNTIRKGQLFLLDAGAETPMGYAGDMSSTFPVSKKFTPEQRDIYEVCLTAHNSAIEALKPGVHFRDVHLLAARIIFDGLKNLGFTKGNTDDAIVNGAHALFFPCGLGHLMGLDVHDMENLGEQWVGYGGEPKSTQFGLKSLRLGTILKPGYVLTIEPGIYFIPQLIDLWQKNETNKQFLNFDKINKFRDFSGLRNEEDVLITELSHRVLGEPLAKSVAEVENERKFAFD
ncbi:MAG: aminopeptidase P family protein [Tenuifilaceae bacterium]|jgi:Xaa-Pro aminopeptidase|nr:aminopeptidase P family protein [Tenuifilaceae bacterium]